MLISPGLMQHTRVNALPHYPHIILFCAYVLPLSLIKFFDAYVLEDAPQIGRCFAPLSHIQIFNAYVLD